MSEKRRRGSHTAALRDRMPVVLPAGVPPDLVRCSVCERPLRRSGGDGIPRVILIRCRHCGALQHRRL